VMFLLDTGARRGELADLQLTDLDLDLDVAIVPGKGRRERALPTAARPPWRWTATRPPTPGCTRRRRTDLMRLAGWKSPQMLGRNGTSAADARPGRRTAAVAR
jgi:integrase